MRTYGQYCPIARGAEIFAERWTPLIIRNLHLGCETFGEILEGAPGLSRTLLAQRLKQLERLGIVESAPKAQGRGHRYQLTSSGHDLFKVCETLGEWELVGLRSPREPRSARGAVVDVQRAPS
jgi:DNA-binding HxlR family transcriptional regulator